MGICRRHTSMPCTGDGGSNAFGTRESLLNSIEKQVSDKHRIHVPLYGALIMLSSGILYLVEYTAEQNIEEAPEPSARRLRMRAEAAPEPKSDEHTLRIATVTGKSTFSHCCFRRITSS